LSVDPALRAELAVLRLHVRSARTRPDLERALREAADTLGELLQRCEDTTLLEAIEAVRVTASSHLQAALDFDEAGLPAERSTALLRRGVLQVVRQLADRDPLLVS
jgi:hypothetical protein